jgi:hypothetical protein
VREIELLEIALVENIPGDIINEYVKEPGYRIVKKFMDRLRTKYSVSDDEALWAINSWISAMEPIGRQAHGGKILQRTPLEGDDLYNYSVNNQGRHEDTPGEPAKIDNGDDTYRTENCGTCDTLNDTANTAEAIVTGPEMEMPGLDERPMVQAGDVKIDNVHFTMTSLKAVSPGKWFLVDIWAHLGSDREEVLTRARDEYGAEQISSKTKGPIRVSRSTLLSVTLHVEDAVVETPEDMLLWDGEIANTSFRVKTDRNSGALHGLATISLDGLQIARLYFDIMIGKGDEAVDKLKIKEEVHRKAFVSYASQDREKVMARLQGIMKMAPHLEIFMDVLSLRSGDYWEQELWKVIPANDVFYLFWSQHARNSPWVEKEWKCALREKGLDFIDPIPLVSPEKAPPPPELSKKHFNEPLLAFITDKKETANFDF